MAGALRFLGALAVAVVAIPIAVLGGVLAATLLAGGEGAPPEPPRPLQRPPNVDRPRLPPVREGDRTLKGVVAAADKSPIAGAKVRVTAGLVSAEATTNEQGRFLVERLPAQPATLVAFADGFRPAYLSQIALDGKDLALSLARTEHLGASRPAAQAGALVVSIGTQGRARPPRLAVAAVPAVLDGRLAAVLPRAVALEDPGVPLARIEGVPPGAYRVLAVPLGASIDARNALGESKVVDIAGGAETRVDLDVRWGGISGRVRSGGAPVERAFVRVVRRSEPARPNAPAPEIELKRTTTDRDGAFLIGELPVGKVLVEVLVALHAPWSADVDVGESSSLDVDLQPAK